MKASQAGAIQPPLRTMTLTTFRTRLKLAFFVSLLIVSGCDRETKESSAPSAANDESRQSDESRPDPRIKQIDGPQPTAETVIARSGPQEVTFADYETYLTRAPLFSPERLRQSSGSKSARRTQKKKGAQSDQLTRTQLANPRMQVQTSRNLLRQKVTDRIADNYDIEVTDAEVNDRLVDHRVLGRYIEQGSGSADGGRTVSLKKDADLPEGVGLQDLRNILHQQLVRQRLEKTLLDTTSKQTIWKWYRHRHNRAAIMYVQDLNVAASDQIDQFVANHSDDIRSYYEKHKDKYRRPRMVAVTELTPRSDSEDSSNAKDDIEARLEKAASRLNEGESAGEVADALGLKVTKNKRYVKRENRQAFGMKPGEAGSRMKGPGAPHAWRVEEIHDSRPQRLDTSLQRQIGSELLQKKGVVPSVQQRLNRVLAIMREVESNDDGTLPDQARQTLIDRLKKAGFEAETTELFTRDSQGFVPGIGLASSVTNLAFSMDGDKPVADAPVADRQHAYAVRLVDREKPSKSAFESNYEEIRKRYRDAMKGRMVDQAIGQWFKQHPPKLDTKPLRAKYGVLRKPN